MIITPEIRKEFFDVVDFHGCYCLDIAMGFRVAKAMKREMGPDMADMKQIVAYTGAPTCAADALQRLLGCTVGKRNLFYTDTGKSVFALQNTKSGRTVRAYVHYWDNFNHDEIRACRSKAKQSGSEADQAALQTMLDKHIDHILSAPESELFGLQETKMTSPPKSSKYVTQACDQCGEHTKSEQLISRAGKQICKECAGEVKIQ